MRLTTFIGAGAAIEIGGPTTHTITTEVRKKKQNFIDRRTNYIERVARVLDKYYNTPCNFEEIYHTLEQIDSYKKGWQGAAKQYTPFMTAFAKPRFKRFFKDDITILIAKQDLITIVAKLMEGYNSKYKTESENVWHTEFWKLMYDRFKLDIATLNYDTCIEQSLPKLEDGFEITEDSFERFNPRKLNHSTNSKIFHLHGCIHYGYNRTKNANKYTLEDDFNDLYKFKSYQDASMQWFGRSSNTTQSAEEAIIGPIITGLKKTDKVINYPYSTYYAALQNSIVENNALLIVGYSFGDLHLNRLLERIVRIHGKKRRIVVITKFTGKAWHHDWTAMNWPENRDMMVFMSKAFQDYYPFDNGSFSMPDSPLISKDGCAKLYLNGFQDAAINHGKKIVEFLSS